MACLLGKQYALVLFYDFTGDVLPADFNRDEVGACGESGCFVQ